MKERERKHSERCLFKFRKSQVLHEEILARTLEVLRPWRRKEVVRNSEINTCRTMGFHGQIDGGSIQRNWSPSIEKNQCFESWILEKKSK